MIDESIGEDWRNYLKYYASNLKSTVYSLKFSYQYWGSIDEDWRNDSKYFALDHAIGDNLMGFKELDWRTRSYSPGGPDNPLDRSASSRQFCCSPRSRAVWSSCSSRRTRALFEGAITRNHPDSWTSWISAAPGRSPPCSTTSHQTAGGMNTPEKRRSRLIRPISER